VVGVLLAAQACFLSHGSSEPDAIPADADDTLPDVVLDCAPAGTYLTPVRLVAAMPDGCVEPSPEPWSIDFPFDVFFDAFFCSSEPLRQIDECLWSVECMGPLITDYVFEMHGTLGMGPHGVYGQLHVSEVDMVGACAFTVELGEGIAEP
jgi:hypothetical protein